MGRGRSWGNEVLRWSKERNQRQVEAWVLCRYLPVLTWRGQLGRAPALTERMLELARPIEDLQVLVPALTSAALVKATQGHLQEAVALIAELDDLTREHHGWRARFLPTAIRILISADQLDEADEFLAGMVVSAVRDQHSLLTAHAIVAEARDEIGQARDF